MNPSSIVIVGAEGSGTRLVWRCLTRHPQLAEMRALASPAATGPLPATGAILHLSLPTRRPMRWFGGEAVPRGVRVVVLRRSPVHTVFTAYSRFYRRPKPAWRNYLHAVALEASWVALHQPLCISYEDLVHNPGTVLPRLYAFLGLDADFVPPVEIVDRNDERWLQDHLFASFMQRAFGFDAERIPYSREKADAARQPPVRLHGGAVQWRGGAILLPGGRGTGTSQLVAALAHAGAQPIADGEVTLDDEGRVLISRPVGATEPVDVVSIVATAYQPGTEWHPKELRGAQAVVPILNHVVAATRADPRLMQVAARLAARVTTLAGPRPDAGRVAAAILAHFDEVIDGPSSAA